ncbi:MAG: hypothetical protein AAFR77_05840 [Cyanobacteria bacterium J06631_2]
MSKEIRRLHRKKTEFTNFVGNEMSEHSLEKTSDKGSRRHRRRSKSDDSINNDSVLPNSTELFSQNIGENQEDISRAEPLAIAFSASTSTNDIDSIRADLLEDIFHSKVTDSDYSDEQYDWGGNSQDTSEDYWHFLASYD